MQNSAIVGGHPIIRKVANLAERLASTRHRVLISGEPGTGRLLVASVLHRRGGRRENPFVVVDCGDAAAERCGERLTAAMSAAVGGTLFLKNIDALDDAEQAQALAALAARRCGNARLILSRSRATLEFVQAELFPGRALQAGALELVLPPLRERRSDIPALVDHFIALRRGGARVHIEDAAALALWRYDWPGNVRQLREEVEAALDRSVGGVLHLGCLSPSIGGHGERARSRPRELWRMGTPRCLSVPALRVGLRAG